MSVEGKRRDKRRDKTHVRITHKKWTEVEGEKNARGTREMGARQERQTR